MSAEIGPGSPLIAVQDVEGKLTVGAMYTCSMVHQDHMIDAVLFPCMCGRIPCDRVHIIERRDECFCSLVFRPLNDPDARIVNTAEPLKVKRRIEKELT